MSAVAPLRRSTAAAPSTLPTPRPAPQHRPRLAVVAGSSRAGRLPFAVLIGAVLVAGLVLLLMLHTFAAQDGFTVRDLQQRAAVLTDEQQQLQVADQRLESPESLRARARAMGMVPAAVSAYRRLKDGRVVGSQQPVAVAPSTAPSTPPASPATRTTKRTTSTHHATAVTHRATASHRTTATRRRPAVTRTAGHGAAGQRPRSHRHSSPPATR